MTQVTRRIGLFLGLSAAVGCSSKSDGSVQTQAGSNAGAAGASAAGAAANGGAVGVAGTAGLEAAGASSGGGSSGGSSGAAGATTTAGATTATGGAAGVGTAPCSATGLVLCDDFEQRAQGAQPMGAPWASSNCFDSTHVLNVDGSEAHSGRHSLVSQGIPYADCQLHADLGALSDFYVRAWVYYAAGNADQFEAHEVSVFELVPAASTDDPSIRVGFRGNTCIPEGIELNITGGMEQTGCTGKTPIASVWSCYELHVQSGSAGVTADLAIDGVDQSYSNHGIPEIQITNPDLKSVRYLRLGARSYSGSYAPLVYVDDVAVGTEPIGCQ
ncbi:MAG TPA: hypothetical protein VGL19_16805 [Polyangiaceae bacterium]|jgi:hypothetical protein